MTTRKHKADRLRKQLNKKQSELRQVMMAFSHHEEAIGLFLKQHAALHSAAMAGSSGPSLEDEILNDVSSDQYRSIPLKMEHSIAWCLWHIARIEDTSMNMLIAGSPQVFETGNWADKMHVNILESGNAMDRIGIADFSSKVDAEVLRLYRRAVGRRTREIAMGLQLNDLKNKVEPARIQQVLDVGAVAEAASGITDYWGRRTIAGLLLMPATRHSLVHLNEALQIKRKI